MRSYVSLKSKNITKGIMILICLSPFLQIYSEAKIDVLVLALISALSILVVTIKKDFKLSPLFYLFVYSICLKAIMSIIIGDVRYINLNRTIGTQICILLICLLTKVQLKDLIKVYKGFAYFSVVFFILQIIFYFVLKYPLMFEIPFLEPDPIYTQAYKYLERCLISNVIFPRFPGPFSEPANYAAFVLPLLIIELNKKDRDGILKSIIIGMTILLSTSGIGIVILSVITFYFAAYYLAKKKMRVPVWLFFAFILIIIGFGLVVITNQAFRDSINNLFVSNNGLKSSKADYRIYRGLAYFLKLPSVLKIFGIGLYDAEAFAKILNINNQFDVETAFYEYFNGVSQIVIYFGFLGFGLVVYYFIWMLRKTKHLGRLIFFAYILLIIGSSHLFDQIGLLYLLLIKATSTNGINIDRKFSNIKEMLNLKGL